MSPFDLGIHGAYLDHLTRAIETCEIPVASIERLYVNLLLDPANNVLCD